MAQIAAKCANPLCGNLAYPGTPVCSQQCFLIMTQPQPQPQPIIPVIAPVVAPKCLNATCSNAPYGSFQFCSQACSLAHQQRMLIQPPVGPKCANPMCTRAPFPGHLHCSKSCADAYPMVPQLQQFPTGVPGGVQPSADPVQNNSQHACQANGCDQQAKKDNRKSSDLFAFCKLHSAHGDTVQYRSATDPRYVMRCANSQGPCNNIAMKDTSSGNTTCCSMRCFIQYQAALNPNGPKCHLPGCGKPVWPLMDYCGKTHADQGWKAGLIGPSMVAPDSARCLATEVTGPRAGQRCWRARAQDANGTIHDCCSKKCADLYKTQKPIVVPPGQECALGGQGSGKCTRPKFVDTQGVALDYCSRQHAADDLPRIVALARDAGYTSKKKVDDWLATFTALKIVKVWENPDALAPNGHLYKAWISCKRSLPAAHQNTILAFHGSSETACKAICSTGFDEKRRSGQVYGPGEYFAKNPTTPMSYSTSKGSKTIIVCELILGNPGVDSTMPYQDYVVMKHASHDLPRYIVYFS